jgi:hypothetical protein
MDVIFAEQREPAVAIETVGQCARRAKQAPRRVDHRPVLRHRCGSGRHMTCANVTS